jgi:hypothetical protein
VSPGYTELSDSPGPDRAWPGQVFIPQSHRPGVEAEVALMSVEQRGAVALPLYRTTVISSSATHRATPAG